MLIAGQFGLSVQSNWIVCGGTGVVVGLVPPPPQAVSPSDVSSSIHAELRYVFAIGIVYVVSMWFEHLLAGAG